MSRVTWHLTNVSTIISETRFFFGLQLARLYNILNANIRITSVIRSNNAPPSFRDQMELIISHCAIVWESINFIAKEKDLVAAQPAWSNSDAHIEMIKNEMDNPNGFVRTVLRRIRNKVISHYDQDVIRTVARINTIEENCVFAEGKASDGSDLVFTLIDDMILKYVVHVYQSWAKDH
jgi:hypothetical protein